MIITQKGIFRENVDKHCAEARKAGMSASDIIQVLQDAADLVKHLNEMRKDQ